MKRRTVKNQTISAILMALAGTAVHAGSQSYLSSYDITDSEPVRLAVTRPPVVPEEAEPAEMIPETEIETEAEAEDVFSPSLSALNLAYIYPDGAEAADAQDSVAGQIIKELSVKDSQWLASIYDLSNRKPEEAAASLGQPADSVKGLYNPFDENQREDDPDSWTISEWSHVDMVFTDENGNRIMADSNIKEIMALANTYFYYSDPEDGDAFLNYAGKLWDQSHAIQYSIGEVYYCDGCLEEISDSDGREETGTAFSSDSNAAGDEQAANPEGMAVVSAEAEAKTAEIGPGIPAASETAVYAAAGGASGEDGLAVAGGNKTAEGIVESGSDVSETELQAETEPYMETGAQTASEITGESTAEGEIGPGIALRKAEEAAAAAAAETASTEAEEMEIKCPGHVDLHIRATVTGLSASNNSLFSMADGLSRGNADGNFAGWNEENRAAAVGLAQQDWKSVYGLTVSSTYIMNPLSEAEMDNYLSLLPADTSGERRQLIRYALSSVGKIPYYWGGKPSAPDYDGNYFGSLTAADEKGRTIKGLDCSGWISWVYWSALGKRLPAESTEGLSRCGSEVAREDLKPGDIIVRLGEEGHVVMFLAWESDGKMKVVHESSSNVNNVTISTMEAAWPYYRKLID